LRIEPFEERTLFAVGPSLVAVIPSAGSLLNNNQVIHTAPTELTFRFDNNIDPNSIFNGGVANIQLTRGGDHILGNGNDVTVTPGYLAIGNAANEVVMRFGSNLPDDLYQIRIVGAGAHPLTAIGGAAFNQGADLTQRFTMDLGAQVVAVVPQPVSRDAVTGVLSQSVNQIEVYFNANDALDATTATNRFNYDLIRTAGTATTGDDVLINPISVTYDAASGKAVLIFGASTLTTAGVYRLRVGNNDPLSLTPTTPSVGTPGSSFGTSANLGSVFAAAQGTQSLTVGNTIGGSPVSVIYPGGLDDPGTRDIPVESHLNGGADTSGVIPVLAYNFQSFLGNVLGSPAYNQITENQKQRAREVLTYYANYIGVEFVETENSGMTIATGDPRVIGGPPNVGGIAGGGYAIMNNAVNWGDSEPAGGYFTTAMHEIGHLLGLGHTYELPPFAVQGSTEAGGDAPAGEAIFPGDSDILLAQYLHPAVGNDIKMYRFSLSRAGTMNLETFAERLREYNGSDPSQLNSVISVYDATGTLIARNDDFFGNDSFLQLALGSGTYYVAVTSTGNINFDPTVPNSGFGGLTQGSYQLRLTFTPSTSNGIKDTSGTLLDGDADGTPGGNYDFWFRVAGTSQTIFVDKAATGNGTGALGSITNPYNTISNALGVATPGSVVRIVGNGGGDKNVATVADNLSYNIGFDSLNRPLSDGSKFEVPQGVTVMIDAGAVLKLRSANIDVGTSAQGIDRSGGAVQVLGTTAKNAQGADVGSVYITSYYNTAIGTDSNTAKGALAAGNWGGLVFRDTSDFESQGIFLSYVNHAQISYGGGQVLVNSVLAVYDPIHLETSRPAISFNTITRSADAAVGATPNSFQESQFQNSTYAADYTRIGPKIYGNTLANNSINGLFLRIRTENGSALDPLTVQARFAATDMIYVIKENVEIQGQPGGLLSVNGVLQARQNARLMIDPGVVIKLGGARIETEIGAQLIAEGTKAKPIVFTSIFDDRYGASGVFDTTNNGATASAAEGDWGGLFFGPMSLGSVDYALITFGGGSTTIEGGFDKFNAVEIHQAQVRIANSTLERNAAGGGGNRSGRSSSTESIIFIRGAQPVIVNNIIQNNDTTTTSTKTAAISINVNALNAKWVNDYGRSTGPVDVQYNTLTNSGPLIRGNRIGNTPINGMLVRGGTLTTDVVWDDTDIVHVLMEEVVANFQFSLSGTIRLQSTSAESLVVKLLGSTAGFTAGGVPLDINDRTGGSLQVLGVGNHPVIFTSLYDVTVGAGLTPAGAAQNDTANLKGTGLTVAQAGDWRSLKLDDYSNDRNVDIVNEYEQGFAPTGDTSSVPATAQYLGQLAKDIKSGDDLSRLGFEIHGSISQAKSSPNGGDVDVYSFKGTAGNTVWFDIDRTAQSLDTLVELIDANGAVVARSDNSIPEQTNNSLLVGIASPMRGGFVNSPGPFTNQDNYTTNPLDAGMRLVLPGTPGTVNTYFVRVRAKADTTADPQLTQLNGGLTKGEYVLQVRLQNLDEFPGSVIRNADIRYATNGVEVIGKPGHSPLLGDTASSSIPHNTIDTAQDIGNLLQTSNAEVSLAGNLANSVSVQWFKLDLNYDLIQSIAGLSNGAKTFATMFNISYADGLGRPDTTISVFDRNGNLILVGRDSDVVDSQPRPTMGSDTANLAHGSYGNYDATIGSVQLPAGGPQEPPPGPNDPPADPNAPTPAGGTAGRTYYIAVSSSAVLPTILAGTFVANPASTGVRLEPVNSVKRIADDRIGSIGRTTSEPSKQIFPGTTPVELNLAAVPYTLADMVLYVNTGRELYTVNPFTGALSTAITDPNGIIGDLTTGNNLTWLADADPNSGLRYLDIAMNEEGRLFSFARGFGDAATPGNNSRFTQIDPGTGRTMVVRGAPITTAIVNPDQPVNDNGTWNFTTNDNDIGIAIQGMTFVQFGGIVYVVGNRSTGNGITESQNLLFRLDGTTGTPLSDDLITNADNYPKPDDITFTNWYPYADGRRILAGSGTPVVPVATLGTGQSLLLAPATGATSATDVRDGMQIILGSGRVEFESGPQLTFGGGGAAIPDGLTFTISGTTFEFNNGGPPVQLGNVEIAYTAADSVQAIGNKIVAAVNGLNIVGAAGTVVSSFARDRVAFLNTTMASTNLTQFTALPGFVVSGSTGVTGSNEPVKFLLTDTAQQLGARIEAAVQNASIVSQVPGVTQLIDAQASGNSIRFLGATPNLSAGLPFQRDSIPTNNFYSALGDITGLASLHDDFSFINDELFAISDSGGLYRVTPDYGSAGQAEDTAEMTLLSLTNDRFGRRAAFTSLTAGPVNVENGRYANILFATDAAGDIYAFNTDGTPAAIFLDGATHVSTGLGSSFLGSFSFSIQGMAFSTLDYNLWHVTDTRAGDDGHGINPTFDYNFATQPSDANKGGQSFYFGLEDPRRLADKYEVAQPEAFNYENFFDSGTGIWGGNARLYNSYNMPGGAQGSLMSGTFSLEGYSAFDLPTLYFDYALDTQGATAGGGDTTMRDSFRVYASADGANWTELSTNNSTLSGVGSTNAELPSYLSPQGGAYRDDESNQQVQELFDPAGGPAAVNYTTNGYDQLAPTSAIAWRQARVDLGDFAGQSNIRLRFDFSTAGSMGIGNVLQGGVYLGAVEGKKLGDGQSFAIDFQNFVFREGLALAAPAGGGPAVVSGETFTVGGRTYELTKTGSVMPGNVAVAVSNSNTPEQIATAIYNAMLANPAAGVTPAISGNRVQLLGAAAVTQSASHSLAIEGSALPATLADSDIVFHIDWTANQVANAIAKSVDKVFATLAGNVDDPTVQTTAKVMNVQGGGGDNVIRLYGHNVTSNGPLSSSSSLQGDQWGAFNSTLNPDFTIGAVGAADRGRNNNHEGVFIDDIVIGFASRGEMVTGNYDTDLDGSPDVGDDIPLTGDSTFTELPTNASAPTRILTGNYQLNIRRGTEYAASFGGGGPYISLHQTLNVNDRLTNTFTLVALPGSRIVDGQTFSITSLTGAKTFEFDYGNGVTSGNIAIPIGVNDSAAAVAIKIRDAINFAGSNVFSVKAGTKLLGNRVDIPNGDRVNLFGAVDVKSGPLPLLQFNNYGDTIANRDQGYTLVEGNRISHTLETGVIVRPVVTTTTNPDGSVTQSIGVPGHTGSVANLPTLNNQQLVPGIAIKDNLIYQIGNTGIAFSGAPLTDIAHAVPFGRIVNNTIAQSPFGIQVLNNAGPTILNNIISETTTAIFVDASSSSKTVVGASVYKSNGVNLNGIGDSNSIVLAAGAPLFVDSSKGNFYLVASSVAIDSSVNSLQERPTLANVTAPMGIPQSPIQAPEFDLLGQLRVDDPNVSSPPGLGSNVFKDRGSLERSDLAGPAAALTNPVDNDAAGWDRNTTLNKVLLVSRPLSSFSIQLLDQGVGIDDLTVTIGKFVIQRTVGGVTTTLEPGIEYTLSYDSTQKIVTLVPVQGVWVNGTYTIVMNNSSQPIRDLAGNNLLANEANGSTQFTIQLTDTATSTWQNPANKYDVNADGIVSGLDVLQIINRLLAGGAGPLPPVATVPPFLDVSGNGSLEPLDALQIINFLNSASAAPLAAPAAATADDSSVPAAAPQAAQALAAESLVNTTSTVSTGSTESTTVGSAGVDLAFGLSLGGSVDAYAAPLAAKLTSSSDSATSSTAASTAAADGVWAGDDWELSDDEVDSITADLFANEAEELTSLA